MLLYITGMQPKITKNTAVFHSNSVKYYHFKQSSCSTLPTATTLQRARGGEGGRLLKDSLLQRVRGPQGRQAPRDSFSSHPQLHFIRARRTTAQQQRALTWLQRSPLTERSTLLTLHLGSRCSAFCQICIFTASRIQ